tara:strand:+ start:37 stop:696 length:660 start_codon:yes stop_codon:yes gene_type:complete
MKYELISPNVIKCENFLPPDIIDLLYVDFLNTRNKFNVPKWAHYGKTQTQELNSHLCGGLDWWINYPKTKNSVNAPTIESLDKWILHQGLKSFIGFNSKKSVFTLFNKCNLHYAIHCISYNKGGYYNWHSDGHVRFNGVLHDNLFTANLILQKPSALKGGNHLFMDKEIIEEPCKNNTLFIFPSYIDHAVSPLEGKDEVSFNEQRFSIQFWLGAISYET